MLWLPLPLNLFRVAHFSGRLLRSANTFAVRNVPWQQWAVKMPCLASLSSFPLETNAARAEPPREPLNKNRSVIEKQEVPNKHLGYRC